MGATWVVTGRSEWIYVVWKGLGSSFPISPGPLPSHHLPSLFNLLSLLIFKNFSEQSVENHVREEHLVTLQQPAGFMARLLTRCIRTHTHTQTHKEDAKGIWKEDGQNRYSFLQTLGGSSERSVGCSWDPKGTGDGEEVDTY